MADAIKLLKSDGKYVLLNGNTNGAALVEVTGSTLVEQKTHVDAIAGVLTFSANIAAIEIYNTDAGNAGTFTVNGIVINVPASGVYSSNIGGTPGATVTVTSATTYIVSRYT